MGKGDEEILRVSRTKDQAKQAYDSLSRIYDYLIGIFEKKYKHRGLELLGVRKGEKVLEIGYGTGDILVQIAEKVGVRGKAYGIDISSGMLNVAESKVEKAGIADRVEFFLGDAVKLPYEDNKFDAAFMSFTLELFDTPEIPVILNEIKRVLRSGGRLGVVSISREYGKPLALRLYEWLHKKIPKYADCRPIYVEKALKASGYQIQHMEKAHLFGLPIIITTATIMTN